MTRTSTLPETIRTIGTKPAAHARADESSDEAARIRAGDTAAFERFFRATYPGVVRYLRARVKNLAVAEELAQDVYLRIWRGRARLDPDRPLPAYLYRSARNAAANEAARRRVRTLHAPPPLASPVASDESVQLRELRDAVRAAIDALPARCRQIFLLSREQGLTYAQIAATLHLSIKTVENHMGRALQGLRERLATFR
jgi:RNA polymerase sigma-70 factor (ECF subfamily)